MSGTGLARGDAIDGVLRGQDAERKRIAQELHDDIGQRLALLCIELHDVEQLARMVPETEQRLRTLRTTIESIASDIHRISHNLHPVALVHVGLVRALRRLCQDFADRRHLDIHFASNVTSSLASQDIALSLYRVAQECLTNVARHSGSDRARVVFTEHSDAIHLTIADDGAGFDRDNPSGGLGLVSIRERVRGIAGTLQIISVPGRGVTVTVRVPIAGTLATTAANITKTAKEHRIDRVPLRHRHRSRDRACGPSSSDPLSSDRLIEREGRRL